MIYAIFIRIEKTKKSYRAHSLKCKFVDFFFCFFFKSFMSLSIFHFLSTFYFVALAWLQTCISIFNACDWALEKSKFYILRSSIKTYDCHDEWIHNAIINYASIFFSLHLVFYLLWSLYFFVFHLVFLPAKKGKILCMRTLVYICSYAKVRKKTKCCKLNEERTPSAVKVLSFSIIRSFVSFLFTISSFDITFLVKCAPNGKGVDNNRRVKQNDT